MIMNKTLRYSLVCLLTLFCGMTYADDVTFDWSGKTETTTPTASVVYEQSPVKLTFSKGNASSVPAENKSGEIRMYNKTQLQIEVSGDVVIKHIEFTASSTTYGANNLTFNGVAISNSWDATAVSNNMTFTATANARFKKIVVTYGTSDGKVKSAPGLAFSPTSESIKTGTELFKPTFSKKTTATVTFASDNEAVATVDSEGNVSLGGGIGTATITATAPENDDYLAGKATFVVTVYGEYAYQKATSIASGKKYIIVAQSGDAHKVMYALNETYTYGTPSSGTVTITDGAATLNTLHDNNFYIEATEGGYVIKDCYGRYVYRQGSYNTFNVSKTAPTDPYAWTIEPQADGTFKISLGGYYLQYTAAGKFNCFASAQDGAVMPELYELTSDPTGITTITTKKQHDGKKYNLNGQCVSDDYKGVYIMNGKKYLNK